MNICKCFISEFQLDATFAGTSRHIFIQILKICRQFYQMIKNYMKTLNPAGILYSSIPGFLQA